MVEADITADNHSMHPNKPDRQKLTLESLLKNSQVITGKDLIKRNKAKEIELALFQEALEFEERHRKQKK